VQIEHRKNPYPWTWEPALGGILAYLLVAVLAAQTGRLLANLFAGAGITWPASANLFTSLPGIFAGDAAAGLDIAHPAASRIAVWTWLAIMEILALAGSIVVLVLLLHRFGPGRMKGMATPRDAAEALGEQRLFSQRRIIRPDLYT
jgi:hypothetical protein